MKKYLLACFILFFIIEINAQEKVNKKEILFSENGRFVFGQISDFRRDQYMLDTQTGRLWQIVVNDKEVKSLEPVLYTSVDGTKTIEPEDADIQLKRYLELYNKNQNDTEPETNKPKN